MTHFFFKSMDDVWYFVFFFLKKTKTTMFLSLFILFGSLVCFIFFQTQGYITAEDLKEHLSPDEADYCLKHMHLKDGPSGDSGALDYKQFAMMIYGPNAVV